MKKQFAIIVRWYLFVIVMLFASVALCENRFPEPLDDYVNDYAQVLDQVDADSIQALFEDLEYQTGIEAVVVTIDSIADYSTQATSIEEFANGLFNYWGVGHKEENNGVLILVAIKDRRCRIELGGAYGYRYDAVMKEIIEEKMIPQFKNDNHSRGIYEGSHATVLKVTKKISWFSFHKWHLLIGVLIIVCIFAGISCIRNGKTGWGWVFFTVAGTLIVILLTLLGKGKSRSGFGGGSSFGGGASGSW